jgi:hypothetical protein
MSTNSFTKVNQIVQNALIKSVVLMNTLNTDNNA